MKIKLKGIIDEDFVNFWLPSMTLMFPFCSFKCGQDFCQNSSLAKSPNIEVDIKQICERYLANPITRAIVCQGLEPMDSFEELIALIKCLREEYTCLEPVVIYTGYDKGEITQYIDELAKYENIIVKFGRYIPGDEPHYDGILGVKLASDNQYAERIAD